MVVHSQAHDVTCKGNYAVPSSLVFGGVWQQVQDVPYWQLVGDQIGQ